MGEGTIISDQGYGLYSVQLNYNRSRIDAEILRLTDQIAAITTKIAALDDGPEKDGYLLRKLSYEKRRAALQNLPADPTVDAWCGDLTEELSGTVGTIEVPGEKVYVNIQPGYDGNSVYNGTRDGALQFLLGAPAPGVFYNLAMLPGWQKWKPTYRYGIISNIDRGGNTCDLALDAATSSQQGIDINAISSYTDVVISYMDCNNFAFKNGDHVIVKFVGQDYKSPLVIGFVDNPRVCAWEPCEGSITSSHPWVQFIQSNGAPAWALVSGQFYVSFTYTATPPDGMVTQLRLSSLQPPGPDTPAGSWLRYSVVASGSGSAYLRLDGDLWSAVVDIASGTGTNQEVEISTIATGDYSNPAIDQVTINALVDSGQQITCGLNYIDVFTPT